MELNQIQNTGTWGNQVTVLNQNFTRISTGIDSAKSDADEAYAKAEAAMDAVEDIGGALGPDAQETLASLIIKVDTSYNTGTRAGAVITDITDIL